MQIADKIKNVSKKPKKKREGRKNSLSLFSTVLLCILCIYAIVLVGLLVFTVITSFSDPFGYVMKLGFPKKLRFNVAELFNSDNLYVVGRVNGAPYYFSFEQMFGLSGWYAVMCGFAKAFTPCIAAYACARFRFKFSKILYTTVIVVMAIPIVGNQPSEFKVVYALGLYDNIFFIWLLKASFTGLYFLVFYEFFAALPKSFVEAAQIDGASNFQIMMRIAAPLAKNVFLTVCLIETINFWNDYQTPLMYLQNYPTLAKLMYLTILESSQPGLTKIPQKAAAAIVILLPTLALFLVFQNKLLGNLTMGGVKG